MVMLLRFVQSRCRLILTAPHLICLVSVCIVYVCFVLCASCMWKKVLCFSGDVCQIPKYFSLFFFLSSSFAKSWECIFPLWWLWLLWLWLFITSHIINMAFRPTYLVPWRHRVHRTAYTRETRTQTHTIYSTYMVYTKLCTHTRAKNQPI